MSARPRRPTWREPIGRQQDGRRGAWRNSPKDAGPCRAAHAGSRLRGACVELKSPGTGLTRESVTGVAGIYEFDSLPVGSYQVKIAQNGFRPVTVNEIILQYSEVRTVDAQLVVGTTSDSVEVTASLEGLNRANAEVGGFAARGSILCQLEIPDTAVREARAQADWLCINAAPARERRVSIRKSGAGATRRRFRRVRVGARWRSRLPSVSPQLRPAA